MIFGWHKIINLQLEKNLSFSDGVFFSYCRLSSFSLQICCVEMYIPDEILSIQGQKCLIFISKGYDYPLPFQLM